MRNVTLSKYALMQQPSIGPFDTLFIYYILLIICTIIHRHIIMYVLVHTHTSHIDTRYHHTQTHDTQRHTNKHT